MKPRKRHDTANPVTFTLSDKNGAVDLSTATSVNFIMKGPTTVKVNAACDVDVDQVANKGKCTYTFADADVNTSGNYRVELQVVWGDGTQSTFPSGGYEQITIIEDLDNA